MIENKKKFIFIIIQGMVVSIVLILFFHLGSFGGRDYNNMITLDVIRDYVVENNLELPEDKTITGKLYSDLGVYEFQDYIISIYEYQKGGKDCKYWSLVWSLYAIKNNYEYKFLYTDNHIFVMFYNENLYCIADQVKLNCEEFENV